MPSTFPANKRGDREDRRRAVFWWILIAASSLASLASFWTTFAGLNLYTPWLLALMASLAVQAGLFALAWFLGLAYTRMRLLLALLFVVMMTFSMLFSYVTFHSHLSSLSASKTIQERLIDRLRGDLHATTDLFNAGSEQAQSVLTRLQDWQAIEANRGWVIDVCENEGHCYLSAVCDRMQSSIDEWETRHQRAYRQGPGQQLIYELFTSEVNTTQGKKEILDEFLGSIRNHDGIFLPDTDNLTRLTRYDTLLESAPRSTLGEFLCVDEVELPKTPDYEDFSRDRALTEQLPAYAFDDLKNLFDSDRPAERDDLWTLLSLGLAAFLDLFVLVVALVGSPFFYQEGVERSLPWKERIPTAWEGDLRKSVEEWARACLPGAGGSLSDRVELVQSVIHAARVSPRGEAFLVPETPAVERFARVLVAQGAAVSRGVLKDGAEVETFTLDDWVLPALTRYVRLATESPG